MKLFSQLILALVALYTLGFLAFPIFTRYIDRRLDAPWVNEPVWFGFRLLWPFWVIVGMLASYGM